MSNGFDRIFTKEQMDAMRRAAGVDPSGRGRAGDRTADPADETLLRAVWRKAKTLGRRLPFAEDLLAAYFCVLDPATPRQVKLILAGALAYFVLPTDAIADFLPFIGFTDDAALLAAAIASVASSITDAHRKRAREALAEKDAAEPDIVSLHDEEEAKPGA